MTPGRRTFRAVARGLAWLLLTVGLFEPAYRVLDGDLDPSIFSAYAYYTAHGLQFGPEIVAMAGPYGFIMYGYFYGGDLFWLRFGAELAFAGLFAGLLLSFFHRAPARSWARWLWFPAHWLFTDYIPDLGVAWAMLLASLCLLEPPPAGPARARTAALAALLGLFALCKGTHLMLALATLGVVVPAWGLRGDWRRAGLILGSFLAGLVGWWLLARQNPLHLPAYVVGTWHLASAYNGAMSLEEPTGIFLRGAGLTAGFLLLLGLTAWHRRRNLLAVAGLALLAGYTFVMWKHGFVRADSHTVIFFCFAVVAVVGWYIHFISRDEALPLRRRALAAAAGAGLLLAALAGPYDPLRPPLHYLVTSVWPAFRFRVTSLLAPRAHRAELEQKLASQRELNQLPESREVVGRAPIDYYGTQQGILLLNGFNYRPRPMGAGTFNVYDPYLMRLNRDFLRDPARRPAFFLVRPATIDNRFTAQDDGLALPELIHGWRPELVEQNLLLMRATPGATAPASRPLGRQVFHFGDRVTVPAVGPDEMLLARFVIGDSWRGGVRAALYKQPPVTLTLEDRFGAPLGERRLVPVMAASPFVFSPVVDGLADLLALYGPDLGSTVGSFTLKTPEAACFTRRITVEFSAQRRPAPLDPYIRHGLEVRLQFPFANAIPESITPAFKAHNVLRYLHAPAEIVWALTGQERVLVFHYGLDSRAYEEGTTNGVEFIVELRNPSGAVTRVFSRMLRPKTVVADQGKQSARVVLPVYAPGSRLVLRTDPGEHGDNSWDWSYVTRIDLQQGRFTATQFPGFDPLPTTALGENVGPVPLDGRPVALLHVPATVGFALTGRERAVSLDFGFLPGAYLDGGHTAGADFVLELHRAGQPPVELQRRALRPLAVEADRGTHTLRAALPAVQAGDRLELRTLPAAGPDRSWGWTYVSRLVIE